MALVVADRIKETSTTSGTGTLTLAGASDGFRSFADIGDGNATYYAIVDSVANTWEVGIGTYTASGTTLSRDTVLSNSSGTTSLISFAANSKDVFVTYPAIKAVYEDEVNTASAQQVSATNGILLTNQVVSSSFTIPSGYNALSAANVEVASGQSVTISDGSSWVIA